MKLFGPLLIAAGLALTWFNWNSEQPYLALVTAACVVVAFASMVFYLKARK